MDIYTTKMKHVVPSNIDSFTKTIFFASFLPFWRKILRGETFVHCQSKGGYAGFQVTGMIEGFFGGLKFLILGFFWVVFFWVA